jgi:hypothetical protein
MRFNQIMMTLIQGVVRAFLGLRLKITIVYGDRGVQNSILILNLR